MVRVRALKLIEHGFSTAFIRCEPGEVAEVPAALADRWLNEGLVVLAPPPPPPPAPAVKVVAVAPVHVAPKGGKGRR